MVAKQTPTGIEAERLAKRFPNTPTRTLAKRLAESHKCTVETARAMIRYVRGNRGKENRKLARAPRASQKAGWKPEMPSSLVEGWEPVTLDANRIGVISDVHIPFHSETAFHSAVKHLKTLKPDCLVINGDFADFYAVSRFQKDPSRRDFRTEMHLVRKGLEWLRHEFGPKCRIVWKLGNHEERWQVYLWNHAPEICELEQVQLDQICTVEKYGVEVIDQQRPIMAGKLPIFHGHELGKGISSPVNPARGAFMRTNHTVLVGHHHRTSGHSDPDLWHDETFTWSTGCLCDLSPEFARVNKWNHGFAYVELARGGEFGVQNFRISRDGKIRAS